MCRRLPLTSRSAAGSYPTARARSCWYARRAPSHPVFQSGLEHEDQGAFFVGLEVAGIAKREHRAPVDRFLARVGDPDREAFAARYGGDAPEERLTRRLDAFGRGLARGE